MAISRLPDIESDKPAEKTFEAYPIPCTTGDAWHRREPFSSILYRLKDIAEVQTAEGRLYQYVDIDDTSKLAFAQLADKAATPSARAFLDVLMAAVTYKIRSS